jgi:mono/diheme cytochrome c family protein
MAVSTRAADIKNGQAAYDKSCKSCHGADGTPNPAIARMFKVDMKALGSSEAQALSDDQIKKIITDGRGKMRPVKAVTGAMLDDVVAYVRSLKK